MTIVPFPDPPAGTPAGGEMVTAAVGRYLDSIKAKTTRSSYAGNSPASSPAPAAATPPRSFPRTTPR